MMNWLERFTTDEHMKVVIEGIGAFYLVGSTSVLVAYHAALGTFSLISVICGAVLGVHAVCRLVLPICRRLPGPQGEPGETGARGPRGARGKTGAPGPAED